MLDWLDVTPIDFNVLLLLEREQLGWLPGWNWRSLAPLAQALHANPAVAWYLRHKNPAIAGWVDELLEEEPYEPASAEEIRAAEIDVLRHLVDLLVYALDPERYDALPFTAWNDAELTGIVDFGGKRVLDIGAGTGRLAFVAAPLAEVVWAVEPVENLRRFIREKAREQRLRNVYAVDGLITAIPFPDGFADVVMGGHVFGDAPAEELAEMERVTRPGGMVVFMPAANSLEDPAHQFLVGHGYEWGVFVEPGEGQKVKFWKRLGGP
jgi:SAM-dependent methyltransferase